MTMTRLGRPGQRFFVIDYETTGLDVVLKAYRVHGIEAKLVSLPGQCAEQAAAGQMIFDLAVKHGKKAPPVLVSDNVQFEWAFTRRLVELAKQPWPFHYCGWDTSLLLEASGVGDPKPAHRALADAGLLHRAIVRALERIGTWRTP